VSRFEDRAAVAAKIAWEGGILDAVDYCLTTDDMPEGDHELQAAWRRLSEAYDTARAAADAVLELLWPDDSEDTGP